VYSLTSSCTTMGTKLLLLNFLSLNYYHYSTSWLYVNTILYFHCTDFIQRHVSAAPPPRLMAMLTMSTVW
jgi:hypothetical protein